MRIPVIFIAVLMLAAPVAAQQTDPFRADPFATPDDRFGQPAPIQPPVYPDPYAEPLNEPMTPDVLPDAMTGDTDRQYQEPLSPPMDEEGPAPLFEPEIPDYEPDTGIQGQEM